MKNAIRKDLENIKKEFSKPRKTEITDAEEARAVKEEIVEQEVVFSMDRFGYVKVCDVASYEKAKETLDQEYRWLFSCKNTDRILLFTDRGVMHQVKALDIPYLKWKDKGVPVDNLSKYDSKQENILYVDCFSHVSQIMLLFVTEAGYVKQVEGAGFETANKAVLSTKLSEGDRVRTVEPVQGSQIVLQSEEGYFLRYPMEEVNVYKKGSVGVRGMALADSDRIKNVYQLGGENSRGTISYEGRQLELNKLKLMTRGQKGTKVRKGSGA